MPPIVAAYNITKSYPNSYSSRSANGNLTTDVLKGVTLTIEPGEFVALYGPSGCGKSSLLNIVGLADRPTSGELILDSESTKGASEKKLQKLRRTKIGYVFQNFNLLSTLTALENVMVPLVLNGHSITKAKSRASELIERVGLSDRILAMPATLSGGEMQRIAICRAVAHSPVIILADEPTGSLDSKSGADVLELLEEQSRRGIALLLATHTDEVIRRAGRAVRIRDGALDEARFS
jgi:putative ABC transport system ATP-binding protein